MKEIKICGLQKTTLLDYPGHVAATIFLGGCNFRCPFCQNAELLSGNAEAQLSQDEVLRFLQKRRTILEGVCITGGEPTLQPDMLEIFIRKIRDLGLLVKLDTNGAKPDVIKNLASQGLLDSVAMDIKAAPGHYPQVCGIPNVDMDAIKESVAWLKSGTLPYEFRTTVVKGLHTCADFEAIGPWIEGCPHYYLQNYVSSEHVLQPEGFDSFPKTDLQRFAAIVAPYAGEIILRGVGY